MIRLGYPAESVLTKLLRSGLSNLCLMRRRNTVKNTNFIKNVVSRPTNLHRNSNYSTKLFNTYYIGIEILNSAVNEELIRQYVPIYWYHLLELQSSLSTVVGKKLNSILRNWEAPIYFSFSFVV